MSCGSRALACGVESGAPVVGLQALLFWLGPVSLSSAVLFADLRAAGRCASEGPVVVLTQRGLLLTLDLDSGPDIRVGLWDGWE